MSLTSFIEAIDRLGETNKARAQALGVSETTYYEIKRGNYPKYLERLTKHPVLIEALMRDAQALSTVPTEVTA